MTRAVKLTLKFVTVKKRRILFALLEAYKAAVNFYIQSLWVNAGRLDKETLDRLISSRLSQRYRSAALKQALEIVISTKRSAYAIGKLASIPVFTGGAVLDAKFVTIEPGKGSFDIVVRLSTLRKNKRISLPTRKTAVLNKWLAVPTAKLVQGCTLTENCIILFVKLPVLPPKENGETLGLDIGINKLVSLSNGEHFGRGFKKIRDKIRRRKPKSKSHARAFKERENYIGQVLNQLPWKSTATLGIEALTGLKHGKKKNRGKSFRKAIAPWTYRQVLTRITNKAQENRVRLVLVDPANTSRRCPKCGGVHKENRKGEFFLCINCGHTGDADTIGAQNILVRTLATIGSVESPVLKKEM